MLRQLLASASRQPTLRRTIVRLRHLAKRNEPWMRRHPFDSAYHVETSGAIPPWLLRSGSEADKYSNSYAGCQPSCLRAALASIPDCHDYRFVDLGCGKGRACIIASEFPFSRIIGIELAPDLVTLARRNTKSVASRYAGRAPIEIIQGDATAVPFPKGHLVVFLYHAFGPELVRRLVSKMLEAANDTERNIFFIYENPVHGEEMDAHGSFHRWFCAQVKSPAEEAGFAPEDNEGIVVWRISASAMPARPDACREIIIKQPGVRAEIASSLL